MSEPALICALLSGALVLYTYALYPLLITLVARFKREQPATDPQEAEWPALTVVVAAHNEKRALEKKLLSLRQCRYPQDKIHILIVSDGSTDGSEQLQDAAHRVHVVPLTENAGKPSALNAALPLVTTPWVVFMDARQRVGVDCLWRLMHALRQPGVGAASGELIIGDEHNAEQQHMGLYWRYEKWIRQHESRVFSTVGATGAVYAMATDDVRPLPADTVLDDVEIPLAVLADRRRIVFVPGACVYDQAQQNIEQEFKRKVRTLYGNFQTFARHRWLFNPRVNRACWQFVSHKVLRLVVPWALLVFWLSTAVLSVSPVWAVVFGLQNVGYALALAARWQPAVREWRLASFCLTFVQLNVAAMVAALRFYTGSLDVRWRAHG